MHPKLLIPFLFLVSLNATAKDHRSAFSSMFSLSGIEPGLCRFDVPGSVYGACLRFPSDLRILDESGAQWPFFLVEERGSSRFEARSVKVLNQSLVEADGGAYLRLELSLAGERAFHNRVKITTQSDETVQRVVILGSDDRTTWGRLGEGYLIDHRRPIRVRNNEIFYPDSDYPYLEIRIHQNARNASEVIETPQLDVGRFVASTGTWEEVPLNLEAVAAEREADEAYSLYDLDSGQSGRPLERLILEAETPEFARSVEVLGRQSASNQWSHIARGEIHRINNASNLSLHLPGCTSRHLRLRIFHGDDRALVLRGASGQAVVRRLYFEAGSGDAALYTGSTELGAPSYDLTRRTTEQERNGATTVEIGERLTNEARKTHDLERWLPWITAAVLAFASLLILWVITGMLRRSDGGLSDENQGRA